MIDGLKCYVKVSSLEIEFRSARSRIRGLGGNLDEIKTNSNCYKK